MNDCVLILPYFGKFNNYFQLFLRSCSFNNKIDWMIFSDQNPTYDLSSNVRWVNFTLDEVRKLAIKKIGDNISLSNPYKLCDYKPTYGLLFEEYIRDYKYWGHCDCDLLFGDLNSLLLPILENGYDKIFAAGHLTIYKNSPKNNRIFMKPYKGRYLYKEVFSSDKIYAFDEDFFDNNIHSIFIENGMKIYSKDISMNVSTRCARITRENYDETNRTFKLDRFIKARYYWDEGHIIRLFCDENSEQIIKEEFLYIHLQMRKMRILGNMKDVNIYEILSDRFVERQRLPKNKKEMAEAFIGFPYLFWWDRKCKYLVKRIEVFLHV